MSIRLLVADNSPITLMGVRQFVAGTEIEIVAEATNGQQAHRLVLEQSPDVALFSVMLPGQNGLETLSAVRAATNQVRVLITAEVGHPAVLAKTHSLGAAGVLVKNFNREELLDAVRRIASGGHLWTRDDLRRIVAVVSGTANDDVTVPLTRREADVLRGITAGQTNRKIAETLGISYETVKEHVQHVLRKVGVQDRTQAAVWAVRQGLP